MKLAEIAMPIDFRDLVEALDVGSSVTSNKQLGNFPKGTEFVIKRVNAKTLRVSPKSKPDFSFVADKSSFGGNVDEGWKGTLAGLALAGAVGAGIVATPPTHVQGRQYDYATASAPVDAKLVKDDNGQLVKVWTVRNAKRAPGKDGLMYLYRPVDELEEAGDLVTTLQPGDTVWVRWNNFTTKTGTVKRIGRTMIHVTLKNGETIAFPPKDVSQDFEELNPNPYREKQGSLSEMTMRVDSFAEFRERCEHLRYVIKIEDGVAVAYDEHGAVVGKFTQDGRHGHGQLVIEHQPPTLINFLSQA